MESTKELEKLVNGLRIIDDSLFRLVASDPLACLCEGFNRYKKAKGGKIAMCNAVQEYAEKYAEEKNAELLIEISIESGLTKEETLERLQKKLEISASKAEEYWKKYNN